MAEEQGAQEKTEEATPRKIEKAREDGQVPRSKDLTTTAVLLAGTLGLWVFGGHIVKKMMGVMQHNLALDREDIFDTQSMVAQLGYSFSEALWSLIPLFFGLVLAAVLGPIALGGWMASGKAIMPKLSRLDPIAGLKRMFSVKSLVELVKSIAKVGVVVGVALLTLIIFQDALLGLNRETLEAGVAHSLRISVLAAVFIASSTLLIAAIDVPYQIWEYARKLRMSLQDIKDEMKDTDGKPEVKGRIRQLQQEMANKRMMSAVPDADVIITNPTHYSVALKYDPDTMEIPILLAKGVDHTAMKIREIARAHKIELVQAPILARAVYHTTEIDDTIPSGLYLAVAQVLAYVFQLKNWSKGQGEKPTYPRNLKIPKDMIYS